MDALANTHTHKLHMCWDIWMHWQTHIHTSMYTHTHTHAHTHLPILQVAVKCVRVSQATELLSFLREVEALSSVRHPHVLPFLGACLLDVQHYWLVTEFMEKVCVRIYWLATEFMEKVCVRICMCVHCWLVTEFLEEVCMRICMCVHCWLVTGSIEKVCVCVCVCVCVDICVICMCRCLASHELLRLVCWTYSTTIFWSLSLAILACDAYPVWLSWHKFELNSLPSKNSQPGGEVWLGGCGWKRKKGKCT